MAKSIETILSELKLSENSTLEELFSKLEDYSVVKDAEILGIKNISVKALPTVVKNQEEAVKRKMYGIVTDEEKGVTSLLNKRLVLLTKLLKLLSQNKAELEYVNEQLDSVNQELSTKPDRQEVEIVDLHLQEQINRLDVIKADVDELLDYTDDIYEQLSTLSSVKANRKTVEQIDSRVTVVEDTKADIDYVNECINSLTTLDIKVVDVLPTENISSLTIYLRHSTEAEDSNIYEEFIYINGNWEKVGDTKADLSNFIKKEETVSASVEMSISDSQGYDLTSDLEIPTTKAVKKIVDTSIDERGFITNEALENKGYLTEHQDISGKADKSDVYTRTQSDEALSQKANTKDVYSKEEIDTKFQEFKPSTNQSVSFTGTFAEYETASANGLIPDGMIVYILDDDDEVIDEPVVDDRTSSLLGVGVLGYMILG